MRFLTGRLFCGAWLVCAAGIVHGASLDVRLVSSPADGTFTIWNVEIQVRANDSQEGIKGMQFDILSLYDGKIEPVGVGSGNQNAKITWSPAVVGNFSTINPMKKDATVRPPGFVPAYPADPDTDADALGASFSDAGNNFNKDNLGVGGYVTVATEQWQVLDPNWFIFSFSDALSIYVLGAQYYDITNGSSPNYAFDYLPENIFVHNVPEPAALILAAISIPALAYAMRRRKLVAMDVGE